MFAGNDISCVIPILRLVKQAINTLDKETMEHAVKAFVNAYHAQIKINTENGVLAALGYTLDEFKAVGLKQLGPEAFSRILYEVQQQSIIREIVEEHQFTDELQGFESMPCALTNLLRMRHLC
jgi:hypothetical protein